MARPLTMRDRYEQARRSGRPLIGGHRGNPAQHPENTLRSFESALELGCDLVECDVHLSADGELIVIHDHTLERTTNGSGMVRSQSLAALRELDAGQGEKLPLLGEVVELVRGRAGLVIELKQAPLPYPGLEEKVVGDLRRLDFLDQAGVISFWHPSVPALKRLEPNLQCGILEVGRPVDPVALLRQAGADVYSPHYSGCDPELVELMHEAGATVGVWTVDDAAAIAWVRVCRPDSVFSNRPAEVGPALRDA
ncbi:MAG TPA: glycerophosphodiester phosphodiesterase family protein [Candidatus Acidoferrales bacterium]|nr:glycerophosphodiester phosphodiesterase family protein [Candidatus Acidoferrales bacterium]